MTVKNILKNLLPPIVVNTGKKIFPFCDCRWTDCPSWEEAQRQSTGYNAEQILNKAFEATLLVKKGLVACERDSVTFQTIQYSWPMLAGLMYAAARNGGALHLVDFGGAFGSSFFQSKKFIERLPEVQWHIVEQPSFIEQGEEHFETDSLHFHDTVEQAISKNNRINTILFSSTLQYLKNPFDILDYATSSKFKFILIDRTSFTANSNDLITVQHVPSRIYNASYPCRFFAFENFINYFNNKGFSLIESFSALDGALDERRFWKGFIFERSTSEGHSTCTLETKTF